MQKLQLFKRQINNKKTRAGLRRALFITGLVWAFLSAPAFGQGTASKERQFSVRAGAAVMNAQKLMRDIDSDYARAAVLLEAALNLPILNSYEQSVIYQILGSAHYEQGDYTAAVQDFEQAIMSGGLLPQEASNLRVNIAQLLIANAQYAQGAQMLEDWHEAGGKLKRAHEEMLWQAWVQAEEYERALPWAERWVGEANPKQRKHYDTLNFLYANLGLPAKQARIVKQMINRWPEDQNLWRVWSSLFVRSGREKDAFEVERMLYLGGVLMSAEELSRLVQYYSYYDMPFQAANILAKEMKVGRIPNTAKRRAQLAGLWRQARAYDKAIPILEGLTQRSLDALGTQAKVSGLGADYAKLAEAYYRHSDCEAALKATGKAANSGYHNSAKLYEQVGMCFYEASQNEKRRSCNKLERISEREALQDKAIKVFGQAEKFAKRSKVDAPSKWQKFIVAEKKRDNNRCVVIASIRRDKCFIEIRKRYFVPYFDGPFNLSDQCRLYLNEYQASLGR